jgi:hypothetical protein
LRVTSPRVKEFKQTPVSRRKLRHQRRIAASVQRKRKRGKIAREISPVRVCSAERWHADKRLKIPSVRAYRLLIFQIGYNPFNFKIKKRKTQKREKAKVDIDSYVLDQTRLRPHFTRLRYSGDVNLHRGLFPFPKNFTNSTASANSNLGSDIVPV